MTDNQHPDSQQPQPNQPHWQPGPSQPGPHQGQPQQPRPPQGPPQYGPPQPPYPPQQGQQQPWPQQPGQPPYGGPAYGQGQPVPPGNQGYAPQPQFQQPYGQQFAQQPSGQQPYGAPPATGSSTPSRVLGWLMALFAVLAIAFCFGPWASAKASSTVLPVSVKMSVNAFNHESCSGSSAGCDSAQDDSNSSSSPAGPTSDDDSSIWEGWVIAIIGAVVIVLGVLRGLGKRALAVPAAVVAGVGGLAVLGMTIYRWSWIHDKAGDVEDAINASGGMSKVDFHFGTGWGLWLTLVAGVLLVLAGAGGLVKRQ